MWRLILVLILLACLGCKSNMSLNTPASKKQTTAQTPENNSESPQSLRGCTIEAIQQVVRAHKKKVTRCYRKGVAQNPKLGGRVVVRIEIGQDGRAKYVGIKEDTMGNKEVAECIVRVLKPLAYPYPGREKCTVFYPFNFTASVPK
ncbi:MAG TPA: AgmX/PglI C-terminal domain-containing protein [Myxococcales bacterium]|nr:AgmX/PglI C-terminal domain-containing protein [Myxococcales bacterium]HIN84900.1 AgmX/PglI C-terminal domain-containing protein [Myxococcales bacterium]